MVSKSIQMPNEFSTKKDSSGVASKVYFTKKYLKKQTVG